MVLATSVAVLAIANVALAEHRGGRISACYDRTSGAVRLIKQGRLPTRCPHGTTAFTFAVRGPQGAPGATGPAGVDGDPGAQGPAGPAGAPGGDGRTILHGSGAPSNASGSDGDFYLDDAAYVLYGPKSGGAWPASGIGLIGADGARGPAGAAGPAGADGADGADGGAGPVGPIGPAGPPGGAGPAGADGLDGLDGATGAIGPEGAAGATGPAGPAGDDGSDGAEGATGPVGAAGPTGPAGPAGPVGPAGQAGADGADGADGATGPSGAAGTDGIDGLDGATGPAGPDGSDGSDGSDGNTILSGSGAPAGSAGVAGDFYLDTGSWTLYGPKASGAWPGSGTSLVGPAGPGEDPVWIQVSDATAQSVAVANTLQNLTWSTNGATDGFVHVPGTAQVLAPRSGVYQLTASIPMQRTGVISPMSTATACLAVNGANVVCQSAGFGSSDLKQGVPLTSIVQLAAGDVITLRFKGTSTSLQVAGSTDSMSVMTIASVD